MQEESEKKIDTMHGRPLRNGLEQLFWIFFSLENSTVSTYEKLKKNSRTQIQLLNHSSKCLHLLFLFVHFLWRLDVIQK